jgi:hypothetical protein
MRHEPGIACLRIVCSSLLVLSWTGACMAGRPLTVDDANVNEPGVGHVEAFAARDPGRVNTWTVAPAYGLNGGIELGASLTRDTSQRHTASAIQAKVRWQDPRPDGCFAATVFGLAHLQRAAGHPGGNAPYVNGLLTCNREATAFHANLGATRPSDSPTLATWGLALEQAVGDVIVHVETFGQHRSKPVFQFGARTDIAKDVQLDGTIGRNNRSAVYSIGVKFGF